MKKAEAPPESWRRWEGERVGEEEEDVGGGCNESWSVWEEENEVCEGGVRTAVVMAVACWTESRSTRCGSESELRRERAWRARIRVRRLVVEQEPGTRGVPIAGRGESMGTKRVKIWRVAEGKSWKEDW